jgi:hypothetical protein
MLKVSIEIASIVGPSAWVGPDNAGASDALLFEEKSLVNLKRFPEAEQTEGTLNNWVLNSQARGMRVLFHYDDELMDLCPIIDMFP